MNTNETQLLNSMLALAALSANISPEELKEYVNALSVDSSKVRQHMDEQVYVKSLVSLDDTIACCARVIDKHLNVTWQDIMHMCREARSVYSSRIR